MLEDANRKTSRGRNRGERLTKGHTKERVMIRSHVYI